MSGGATNPCPRWSAASSVLDFVGMIAEQSALAVEATSALVSSWSPGRRRRRFESASWSTRATRSRIATSTSSTRPSRRRWTARTSIGR